MNKMKMIMSRVLVLALICWAGTAGAASIQISNGPVSLTAVSLTDGEEFKATADTLQIAGTYADGDCLVRIGNRVGRVSADALEKALILSEGIDALALTVIDENTAPLGDSAKGKPVSQLQVALRTLGYFSGTAGGTMDKKTREAITAFQQAVGLEASGEADIVTRLLAEAMAEEPVEMEGMPDPEALYAPIIGKTDADLTVLMESGLRMEYDEMSGNGFISDGNTMTVDASGTSDLEKYEVTVRIGLATWEDGGKAGIVPAILYRCVCVRRPVMTGATVKAGEYRGSAATDALSAGLEGLYTVEEGRVLLTEEMAQALAAAEQTGELKIRIEGMYRSFDLEASADMLEGLAKIGEVALSLQ